MKKLSIWVKLRKLKYILPCLKITFYLDISAKLYIIKIRTLVRKKFTDINIYDMLNKNEIVTERM